MSPPDVIFKLEMHKYIKRFFFSRFGVGVGTIWDLNCLHKITAVVKKHQISQTCSKCGFADTERPIIAI